jgi:hypothetical protein
MMPVNDIHLDLYRIERQGWSPPSEAQLAQLALPARGGLRYRVGQALIAGGRALSGPAPVEPRTSNHIRPVSAHR